MNIYIDIDETICYYEGERDYNNAIPIIENIKKANNLYDAGHIITYWTARGTKTGIDWTDITIDQFKKWNVKYHYLKMGKPAYDLLIDDRSITNFDNLNIIDNV
jgi:hypothetical protein